MYKVSPAVDLRAEILDPTRMLSGGFQDYKHMFTLYDIFARTSKPASRVVTDYSVGMQTLLDDGEQPNSQGRQLKLSELSGDAPAVDILTRQGWESIGFFSRLLTYSQEDFVRFIKAEDFELDAGYVHRQTTRIPGLLSTLVLFKPVVIVDKKSNKFGYLVDKDVLPHAAVLIDTAGNKSVDLLPVGPDDDDFMTPFELKGGLPENRLFPREWSAAKILLDYFSSKTAEALENDELYEATQNTIESSGLLT